MARAIIKEQILKDINGIIDEQVEEINTKVIRAVKDAYREMVEISPKLTGYYASNHRISLKNVSGQFKRGSPNPKLVPKVRPEPAIPGILFTNIAVSFATEFEKIEDFTLGDSVTISTGVPYAEEVERNHNVYNFGAGFIAIQLKQ